MVNKAFAHRFQAAVPVVSLCLGSAGRRSGSPCPGSPTGGSLKLGARTLVTRSSEPLDARLQARRQTGCGQEGGVPPAASPSPAPGRSAGADQGSWQEERFKDEAFWGFTATLQPHSTGRGRGNLRDAELGGWSRRRRWGGCRWHRVPRKGALLRATTFLLLSPVISRNRKNKFLAAASFPPLSPAAGGG